jgi:uncharacterized protein (TIGR02147 family)
MEFSIYNYRDYQKALNDFYQLAKGENPIISHRYIAQKMGFSSGFFSQIISGKSNISEKNIPKFASLLKLNREESAYFETLVLYNQAKIPETKKLHFEKLLTFKRGDITDFGKNDYLFYGRWYYSATLELLDFFPFNGENYDKLSQMLSPSITEYEAQQAISMLKELKLIEKSGEFYKKSNRLLTTSNPNHSKAVTSYAQHMIELGKESIENYSSTDRSVSWLTMSIDRNNYQNMVDEVRQFRRKIMEMASDNSDASQVFQLNVQLFPLSDEYISQQ